MTLYDIEGNVIGSGGISSGIDYDNIVKNVNHRGYNSVAPENTLPAFKLSRQNGFMYVETDVRFTSDGTAVCLHDESISRTARNSDGTQISFTVNIADITYEQALTYDFGIWKGSSYVGTKIPTFDEFLTLCKNFGLRPYIELKTGTQAQIEAIVDAVVAHGLKGKETYISFETTLLGYVKDYDATARLGFLDMGTPSLPQTAKSYLTGTNEVFLNSNNTGRAADCIAQGIGYEVWTVDSASVVLGLDPYITGVTTNGTIIPGKVLYEGMAVNE